MDLTGSYEIPEPREKVWAALNDPEVLARCLSGCESLERTSDTEFDARINARIGPVKARFTGTVTLSAIDPPNGYRIDGALQGGAAGFAKGGATVTLHAIDTGTRLEYAASADVGGKLASVGSRLVQGVAKKMADDFFAAFAGQAGAVEAAAPAAAAAGKADGGIPAMAWIAAGVIALAAVVFWVVRG